MPSFYDLIQFEREAWTAGYGRVAGIDEAGRGPLAGPVVAAAVCFTPAFLCNHSRPVLEGLTDSKALSEGRRNDFYATLRAMKAASIGVGSATPEEIDTMNILRATHLAMARAVLDLRPPGDFALVDGNEVRGLAVPSRSIVKGDRLSLSISAASVIAKVTRDRMMTELDAQYPGYGFAAHKGYGTAAHLEALARLGPSPCHRRSFRPVSERQLGFEPGD
ncbi:ribonuclease HII [Kiritimatiella glycovorans]|uniref:Ribonuclease HII n=1 Tax=Kiritimatiella glycovorans TaxID=1307763 RepID=A0A0G3EAV1_9BACT|nr:ribonuclease HII [Kiritimatiella glycovorans]AKJ63393.1 Ribonuclease HII [Kiritimatiella glycovorans]